MYPEDTICALASGAGRAGVAVIRVSGPGTQPALAAMAGYVPEARRTVLRMIGDPRTGETIDQGLVVFFPAPHSFTGEDVAEFHLHGGKAVISATISVLTEVGLARLAEPGEFTRRAFNNGKLDLTEVEGLADLVEAETSAQRRQALRQMGGSLSALYLKWREQLIRAAALVEAAIDFPDEDVPGGVVDDGLSLARGLRVELAAHLADDGRGERLRDGLVVALVGAPNAGKSTLLNALAKRDVAIVSDEPGTTRDVLEVHLDLGGYPVTILDLAGVRDAESKVEQEGVRRARERAASANLRLFLKDPIAALEEDDLNVSRQVGDLTVCSKADLAPELPMDMHSDIQVSAHVGTGMDLLLGELTRKARDLMASGQEGDPVLSRARHRQAVTEAINHLDQAEAEATLGAEIVAENLRLAALSLGRLMGKVDVEDLLDVIFAEFCMGK